MSISFAVIFKSSHFNQFKSQYMVVILVMIQQPRFIFLWCDTVVNDYIKANSLGKNEKQQKIEKLGSAAPLNQLTLQQSYVRWYLEV